MRPQLGVRPANHLVLVAVGEEEAAPLALGPVLPTGLALWHHLKPHSEACSAGAEGVVRGIALLVRALDAAAVVLLAHHALEVPPTVADPANPVDWLHVGDIDERALGGPHRACHVAPPLFRRGVFCGELHCPARHGAEAAGRGALQPELACGAEPVAAVRDLLHAVALHVHQHAAAVALYELVVFVLLRLAAHVAMVAPQRHVDRFHPPGQLERLRLPRQLHVERSPVGWRDGRLLSDPPSVTLATVRVGQGL
mmetsp:Transcript_17472/g.56267  ORF Transcript_17472/g.56267 Transcript_17472/m.56267 type:complete len:254 (-) Transcript_17472:371-1132(-)